MTIGLAVIIAIGLILAGICLQTRQESWSYPDALAGALFLVSGAVFPISVLPTPIQAWPRSTRWLVDRRRPARGLPERPSSIGGASSLWTTVTGTLAPDATTIVLALLVTGALVTLAATGVFRASERRAKDRGLLDQTTGS